jgi:molecular chaperone Hsp33
MAADPDRRPDEGQRYQGIVDLDGETLSECFTNYFVMSQQVGTRFKLCADGRHARGLLLQQLPADRLKDEEERAASWQHITALASTLTADEC